MMSRQVAVRGNLALDLDCEPLRWTCSETVVPTAKQKIHTIVRLALHNLLSTCAI